MLDFADLAGRWDRVRAMMEKRDLDVVVAIDLSRDEIMLGSQRWLTGFSPLGQPAAALVFRDGHLELVSPMLFRTVPEFYAASGLPIELVPGFVQVALIERIARASPRRVGIAEAATFPAVLAQALAALPSPPELVDVTADMVALRARKSVAELEAIRKSCAIADAVWRRVPEFFRVGRTFHAVVADVDHAIKREGGESGFYLFTRLPVTGVPFRFLADPDVITSDSRYMLEISPRYQGYYSQLTAPVVTGSGHEAVVSACADLVAAKEFAQPLMIPGADLTTIAAQIEAFLAERGRAMTSRSLGHFCGIALEEPRHDPSKPMFLEEGMTLIFHPVLADPNLMLLMRADTYVITQGGADRLNALPMTLIEIA